MLPTAQDITIAAGKTNRSQIKRIKQARLGGYLGEQARCSLIKEHYPWILVRCAQILRNEEDAKDAAQEVAMRMHKSLGKFEGRSSLRTWLSVIIRNECVSFIRKQQQNVITNQLAALIEIYEQEQRFGETADPKTAETVLSALNLVSPVFREVLQLRFFKELPIAEIGALLGITVSAAKMRLYRAMDAFEATFNELAEPKRLAA